jgi:hypothetical protein
MKKEEEEEEELDPSLSLSSFFLLWKQFSEHHTIAR